LADRSSRPADAKGIRLNLLERTIDDNGYHYTHVNVAFDRAARTATITVNGPDGDQPQTVDEIHAAGEQWWPLAMARQLDDAVLMLRVNELDLGLWLLKTGGRLDAVLASDRVMLEHSDDWMVRETVGLLRRTFARLEVSSRSMYAIIEPGSCFAGVLFELALAADRSYMLSLPETDESPKIAVDGFNFGLLPTVNGRSRLHTRFGDDDARLKAVRQLSDQGIGPEPGLELGLVTLTPDDLDWEDEVRIAVEERAALSPDALTGLEASLRFPGNETIASKLFGRLSAWQNWVFIRPNSTGEHGALKLFGTGAKARFTWERV
jgi:benzoyl-CoA-dihydrodiol lyase